MSEGGSENATKASAVYDSTAATVVVSLGGGGPGIGRRAARPPQTKDGGIRRPRDDARTSVPPRATGPGRYRANQRGMPRRSRRESRRDPFPGFALRPADAAAKPRIYNGGRVGDCFGRGYQCGNLFRAERR